VCSSEAFHLARRGGEKRIDALQQCGGIAIHEQLIEARFEARAVDGDQSVERLAA
jgi:hypothetical protein